MRQAHGRHAGAACAAPLTLSATSVAKSGSCATCTAHSGAKTAHQLALARPPCSCGCARADGEGWLRCTHRLRAGGGVQQLRARRSTQNAPRAAPLSDSPAAAAGCAAPCRSAPPGKTRAATMSRWRRRPPGPSAGAASRASKPGRPPWLRPSRGLNECYWSCPRPPGGPGLVGLPRTARSQRMVDGEENILSRGRWQIRNTPVVCSFAGAPTYGGGAGGRRGCKRQRDLRNRCPRHLPAAAATCPVSRPQVK